MEKNTFEWSRTTGGRKEGTEERRWLCLALAVAVNRGFGNNWLSRLSLAHVPLTEHGATHQSQSAIPFAFHGQVNSYSQSHNTSFLSFLPMPLTCGIVPPFLVSSLLPLI